jgi:hypothetical protein
MKEDMMKLMSFITGTMALLFTACQHLPGFSRSGEVRDIAITERLSAVTTQVNVGDEIRWTNMHSTPVRITVSDYVLDKLSCRSKFRGHFNSGADAHLQPNESASLCFAEPGTIRYVVRIQPKLRNGEIVESGHIEVGTFARYPCDHKSTGEFGVLSPPEHGNDIRCDEAKHLRPSGKF